MHAILRKPATIFDKYPLLTCFLLMHTFGKQEGIAQQIIWLCKVQESIWSA